MSRWTMLMLPTLLQDPEPRLRVYLDQRTPPRIATRALRVATASGLPFDAFVVVRDFESLDRDLLEWTGAEWTHLRLADREALRELGRNAGRLPCFILNRHRAHGIPGDLEEMVKCTRR